MSARVFGAFFHVHVVQCSTMWAMWQGLVHCAMVSTGLLLMAKQKGETMAEYRDPPENDHDALMALWHAVIGTNGSGIMARMKRLEERPRNRALLIKDILIGSGIVVMVLERVFFR